MQTLRMSCDEYFYHYKSFIKVTNTVKKGQKLQIEMVKATTTYSCYYTEELSSNTFKISNKVKYTI